MKVLGTTIKSVGIIDADVYKGERGHVYEAYNAVQYRVAGVVAYFVEDNESFGMNGVVRNVPQKTRLWFRREAARIERARRGSWERRLMFNDTVLKIEECAIDVLRRRGHSPKANPEGPQGCAPKVDMPILLSEKDQKHSPLAEIESWCS